MLWLWIPPNNNKVIIPITRNLFNGVSDEAKSKFKLKSSSKTAYCFAHQVEYDPLQIQIQIQIQLSIKDSLLLCSPKYLFRYIIVLKNIFSIKVRSSSQPTPPWTFPLPLLAQVRGLIWNKYSSIIQIKC